MDGVKAGSRWEVGEGTSLATTVPRLNLLKGKLRDAQDAKCHAQIK